MSTFENKMIILEHLKPQESFLYMTVEVGVDLTDEEKNCFVTLLPVDIIPLNVYLF